MSTLKMLTDLQRRVELLEIANWSNYLGTSNIDFTTTSLPQHGDYGFQTADNEIQVNCNGTIRAISTAAL